VVEDYNRSFLLNLPVDSEFGASGDDSDEVSEAISETKLGRKEEFGASGDDSDEVSGAISEMKLGRKEGNPMYLVQRVFRLPLLFKVRSPNVDFPNFDNVVKDSNDHGS
nr:hypothetical protein [Tanacetum cinerariifolium]